MAKLNLQFYQGESEYSDGKIEHELLELFESRNGNENKDRFLKDDERWPVLYHLSDFRQNILSWYPFAKDSSLLEVGAGCGALTGLFCQRVKNVTSVELTEDRSKVNYSRNKEFDNLEIITGNFHNIKFDQKYDYIILNGVLEYAGSFTAGDNPYSNFLIQLKELLSPSGIILIAIENKLGMKYLNGAPEDHTNQLFSGLNGYPGNDSVRTFTKKELNELFKNTGFKHRKFFYPSPDYKFPSAIYTDQSIDLADYNLYDYAFNANRLLFYNEANFVDILKNEEILASFFNSFLIEIAQDGIKNREYEIEFVKLPLLRKKKFCLQTIIIEEKGKRRVFKSALFSNAQKHLDNMLVNYNRSHTYLNYQLAEAKKVNDCVEFEYIEGPSLLDKLINYLDTDHEDSFESAIKEFTESFQTDSFLSTTYCKSEAFQKVFGSTVNGKEYLCQSISNIDMIFPNIIDKNNIRYLIDYEWIFDFPVPVDFIIWRALFMAYYQNEIIRKHYSFEELLNICNIDSEDSELFYSWHSSFSDNYVSDRIIEKYRGKRIDVDNLLNAQLHAYNPQSVLYIDFGDGFTDNDSIAEPLVLNNGHFKVEFDIKRFKGIKTPVSFRWDPCSNPVILNNIRIEAPKEVRLIALNAVEKGSQYIFFTGDPQYLLSCDYSAIDKLTVTGTYEARIETIEDLALENISELLSKNHELKHQLQMTQTRVETLEKILKDKLDRPFDKILTGIGL